MFRLLYVTDLHGWTDGYEQISIIAQEEEITTIVMGISMRVVGSQAQIRSRSLEQPSISLDRNGSGGTWSIRL